MWLRIRIFCGHDICQKLEECYVYNAKLTEHGQFTEEINYNFWSGIFSYVYLSFPLRKYTSL